MESYESQAEVAWTETLRDHPDFAETAGELPSVYEVIKEAFKLGYLAHLKVAV